MLRFRQAIPPGPAISPEDRYTGHRPYVVGNLVSSADGKATAGGRTAPLAGEGDKAAFSPLGTQVGAEVTVHLGDPAPPIAGRSFSRLC